MSFSKDDFPPDFPKASDKPLTAADFERLYLQKMRTPTKTCEFCRYWLGYGYRPKARKCSSLKSPAYREVTDAAATCDHFAERRK